MKTDFPSETSFLMIFSSASHFVNSAERFKRLFNVGISQMNFLAIPNWKHEIWVVEGLGNWDFNLFM